MSAKKLALIFPGQGSQYVGMAKPLIENFPWTKCVYEEASESIQQNLLKLCQEGPEETLQLTMNQQPCTLTTSYAWFRVLEQELEIQPQAAGGHSLGEYSALLAARALSLQEAVRLVRTRGEMMQSAVPVGVGKMAAVIGLSNDYVEQLCAGATQGDNSVVVPANFNAPGQVVVAGHAEAVDRLIVLAKGETNPDLKARKVIPLNVSAPFHSPLMQPVAEKFAESLKAVEWKPLIFPVVFNVDGELRSAADLVSLMKQQIDHPVRWTKCVEALFDAGYATFLEPGPSKVLTGLNRRIVKTAKTFSVECVEDLKAFEVHAKEEEE